MVARAIQPIRLMSIAERVEIAPDVWMPRLGVGTSRAYGAELVRALASAFDLGYRLVDTSANYDNEQDVGTAIAVTGVPREELFVTTKLEEEDQGARRARLGLEASLRRLGLDYVDLYLIHWPKPARTKETWLAMQGLLEAGLTRSIGVSNFEVRDLEQVRSVAAFPPAVNQIKFNPLEQRRALRRYCGERGIAIEAWEPVMRGSVGNVRMLADLGLAHGKTAAQISLRWILQHGAIAIPKSVHEARLRENADIYDFALGEQEMRAIDAL